LQGYHGELVGRQSQIAQHATQLMTAHPTSRIEGREQPTRASRDLRESGGFNQGGLALRAQRRDHLGIVGGAESLFGKARGPKAADSGASDERLYAEIGRLEVELDWLRKGPG
jgi:hypothetical protein